MIGKWYITIGNLCFGFGRPPADLVEQRLTDRPSWLPLKAKPRKTQPAPPSPLTLDEADTADAAEASDICESCKGLGSVWYSSTGMHEFLGKCYPCGGTGRIGRSREAAVRNAQWLASCSKGGEKAPWRDGAGAIQWVNSDGEDVK